MLQIYLVFWKSEPQYAYKGQGDLRKWFVSGRRPIEKSGRSVGKKKIFQKKNFLNFFLYGILSFICIFINQQFVVILINLFKDSIMPIYGPLQVTSKAEIQQKEESKLGPIQKLRNKWRGEGVNDFITYRYVYFEREGGILRNNYVTSNKKLRT